MPNFSSVSSPRLVYQHVLETLRNHDISGLAAIDVRLALERVSEESQRLFIWAAEDGGVQGLPGLSRLASIWLASAAVNLADDMADEECSYLEAPVAPGVVFLLLAAAGAVATEGRTSVQALRAFQSCLARAAAGQSREVRTTKWTAEGYREIAEQIGGEQFAAYFRLIWDGTSLTNQAEAIGRSIGCLGVVFTDIASRDRRYHSLPAEGRANINAWCEQLRSALRNTGLRCAARVAQLGERYLSPSA